MDLLSHFLNAVKIRSTSLSRWQVYGDYDVLVDDFQPGFFLTLVSGPPVFLQVEQQRYLLEKGAGILAPSGARCRFGQCLDHELSSISPLKVDAYARNCHNNESFKHRQKNAIPINQLNWRGLDEQQYAIESQHARGLEVTVGESGDMSVLCGIAFSLQMDKAAMIAEVLPDLIPFNPKQNPSLSLLQQQLELCVDDQHPGFFSVAMHLAELMLISCLRQFVLQQKDYPVGVLRGLKDKRLYRSLQWIHGNFSENVNIEILANAAGQSRSRFMANFTDNIGITPMAYVNHLRIQHSCELLLTREMSIAQVSEKVGFNSERVFRRQFTQLLGQSPGKYARSQEAGESS